MPKYLAPSVYIEEVVPRPDPGLRTGIPVFLGLTDTAPDPSTGPEALVITCWAEFEQKFGHSTNHGFLRYAVHGFFQNGGRRCYVLPLASNSELSLRKALERLESWETFDLVCAPDLTLDPAATLAQQRLLLDHCEMRGDLFCLLDALPGSDIEAVLRQRRSLNSAAGALYYPWIGVDPGPASSAGWVPPCGHIAGIYARSDKRHGVHKAPANEVLEGVTNLELHVDRIGQERLNPFGVNCLRLFVGRGFRVWGARTLSAAPEWRYINVRRLLQTIGRWCETNLADVVFEPNHPLLWDYIRRALKAYFNELYQAGALQGASAQEAYYVNCNALTNGPEIRKQGKIVTEIGLAVSVPSEFVVVRIIHDTSGVSIDRSM